MTALIELTTSPPAPAGRMNYRYKQLLRAAGLGLASLTLAANAALAQSTAAASRSGTLGEQLNTMSSEAIDSGGTFLGMAAYHAAVICFLGGVWALWQSRQPQNREGGKAAMGLAGIALAGFFAVMPQLINKAANTAAGADATINNTAAQVKFAR